MAVENLLGYIQQFEQLRITDGVINIRAIFSGGENVAAAKHGQLLRKIALLYIQTAAKLVDADLASSEGIQYAYAQRVGEGFEEFGLKLAQFCH